MNELELKTLLEQLLAGEINLPRAVSHLKNTAFKTTDLKYATLDHHRELRHGLPEVIFGEKKSSEQIIEIASHLSMPNRRRVLITRLDTEKQNRLKKHFPDHRVNEIANTFTLFPPKSLPTEDEPTFVAIVSAGTSDMNVAEEAAEVCIAMNIAVKRLYDVGVSGLHRVFAVLETLQNASVVIVVAGMEGALPSVIGGLIGSPVIAVPTSVGYGACFQGLAALLGMLNSCASGLVVTNIDAGFSAGFAAARIINWSDKYART